MDHTRDFPKMLKQTPENRRATAEKVVAFLQKSKIWEIVKDPGKVDQWRLDAQTEEIEDLLERLNGILVGTPIKERDIYTFSNQILHPETKDPLYQPPDSNVQAQILRNIVIPALKQMSRKDVAIFSATSVNMLHMFQDGNGRVSRLIYWILDPEKSLGKTDEQLTDELTRIVERREGTTDFNPGVLMNYLDSKIWEMTRSQFKEAVDILEVSNLETNLKEAKQLENNVDSKKRYAWAFLSFFESDPIMYMWAMREYVLSKPASDISKYVHRSTSGKLSMDINMIVEDMTSDREVVTKLLENVERFKYFRFKILAEVFLSPQKHLEVSSGLPIKERFEEVVQDIAKNTG